MGVSDFLFSKYDEGTGRRYFQDPKKQAIYDEKWKRNKSCRMSDSAADDFAIASMAWNNDSDTKLEKEKRLKEHEKNKQIENNFKKQQEQLIALEEARERDDEQYEMMKDELDYKLEIIDEKKQELQELLYQIKLEKMEPDERLKFEENEREKAAQKVLRNLKKVEEEAFENLATQKQIRKSKIQETLIKREQQKKAEFNKRVDERNAVRLLKKEEWHNMPVYMKFYIKHPNYARFFCICFFICVLYFISNI